MRLSYLQRAARLGKVAAKVRGETLTQQELQGMVDTFERLRLRDGLRPLSEQSKAQILRRLIDDVL